MYQIFHHHCHQRILQLSEIQSPASLLFENEATRLSQEPHPPSTLFLSCSTFRFPSFWQVFCCSPLSLTTPLDSWPRQSSQAQGHSKTLKLALLSSLKPQP